MWRISSPYPLYFFITWRWQALTWPGSLQKPPTRRLVTSRTPHHHHHGILFGKVTLGWFRRKVIPTSPQPHSPWPHPRPPSCQGPWTWASCCGWSSSQGFAEMMKMMMMMEVARWSNNPGPGGTPGCLEEERRIGKTGWRVWKVRS